MTWVPVIHHIFGGREVFESSGYLSSANLVGKAVGSHLNILLFVAVLLHSWRDLLTHDCIPGISFM
jgi:hypothetical protein